MDLPILEIVYKLITGLVIGFVIGLTGVGGGVLVMPALTILFKFETTMAVGTASMYAFLTKIYAGLEHFRLKNIDFSVSNLFLFGAVPGNIITIFAILWYTQIADPADVKTFQANLKIFIAVIMLFSSAMMIYNLFKKKKQSTNEIVNSAEKKHNLMLGLSCGLIIGALIGATSVGGGVLVVPMLVIFFGLTTNRTVGSSIYIALILVGVSSILYSFGPDLVTSLCNNTKEVVAKAAKQVDYSTAIIMAVGSITGVFFGSRLSVKMPEKPLTIFVIILILISAIMMLAK